MGVIGVIAVNAFRESLRDKILYNLVLFAGLLIGLSVLLADLSITEHHKVIADMGLAAINLIGVIIAMFVGISLVNKEIERRTIYTIMARPISRSFFIMGKYFGLALTLLVNMSVMLAVFLLTLWLYHVPIKPSLFATIALRSAVRCPMTYSPKVKIALSVEEVNVEKKSAIAVTTRISTNINCTAWNSDGLIGTW